MGGGTEMYIYRAAGALKKLGHTPIIISLGSKEQHYKEDGIEVYFVCHKRAHAMKNQNADLLYRMLYQSWIINIKVKEILRQRKIDIIQFTSLEGIPACYYGTTPVVMRLSSYAKQYYKDYPISKIEYGIRILSEWLGAQRCNAVFAPSRVSADEFAKDIHRPVSVIETPFWDDCKYYDESMYVEKLKGKKYSLFIGRLHIEKGIFVMAECIQDFLRTNPEYYFVCCGNDGFVNGQKSTRFLRKAAGIYENRFIYIEGQPHETLYPIIQHADFVVCPSIAENFSNACIEAMYFRRVVIGTDGTSFEQLIDNGKNGMLCEPGNAGSLLKMMNEAAVMNQEKKDKIGENARKRIERLKPEIVIQRLVRFYKYVINQTCR